MATVMVIDNWQSDLLYMELLIKWEGWCAILLQDATTATQVMSHQLPDLVMLDWMVSGKVSSQQFIADLKQNLHTQHIPVICITAATEVYTRKQLHTCGCDGYLGKPFSIAQWRAAVMQLIGSHT